MQPNLMQTPEMLKAQIFLTGLKISIFNHGLTSALDIILIYHHDYHHHASLS